MISGLTSAIGSGGPSLMQSITITRFVTPTCGAARPMPGASYIVSSMSAASWRDLGRDLGDGVAELLEARVRMDQDRADHVPGFTKARRAWQEEGREGDSSPERAEGLQEQIFHDYHMSLEHCTDMHYEYWDDFPIMLVLIG